MLPQSHPYIKNYLANKSDLRGLGNSIRVVVENTQGDIFDPSTWMCCGRSTTISCSPPGWTAPG